MGYVTDNLALLSDIAKCIAMEFGENCEVVLHDLTLPYNKTVVAIWNGHVTGRKVGDGGTNAGLEILKGTAAPEDQCYINTLPNGHILRTASKYFRDEYGKVNGSLCINFDITDLVQCGNLFKSMTELPQTTKKSNTEFFMGNIDDLLTKMMTEAVKATGKAVVDLSKDDKVQIVHDLDRKGFFLVKKSAKLLADFLGLSRYSIYNYLNEIKDEGSCHSDHAAKEIISSNID